MVKCLVIRPCFDEASQISYSWCEEIITSLSKAGYDIIDLAKEKATRTNVECKIEVENPSLVVFYDHGDEKGLIQQDGKAYVIDEENDHLLAGREIYTLACLWGSRGGVDTWKKGAIAVWCYVEAFAFTTEDADVFKEFANCGLKFKLEGKTWEEALQQAKSLAKELAQKLIEAGKYFSSILLQQDADALRCYTPNNPPTETKCILRKVALKIFGPKLGWRISRSQALGWLFFLVGYGVTLHAVADELYWKGGYAEIFKPQGEWVGLALVMLGFILLVSDVVKWLRK